MVGGGVLGWGCVQEEIRFLISPELIVSRLVAERLGDNECLLMTGFERYSKYKGYASTFKFDGSYDDQTPIDPNSGHRLVRLVAIDARRYQYKDNQYSRENIIRELNKAYVGFVSSTSESSSSSEPEAAVATGNWGCGAFGGDADLKSLIQMMAASAAGRDVAYFAFGDRKLRDSMDEVHKFLREKEVTVGALLEILLGFGRARNAKYNNLNEHIYNSVLSFEDDAASEGEEKKEKTPLSKREEESKPNCDEEVEVMDVEGEVAAEADAVATNDQDQPVQHVEEGERTKLKVLLRAKKDQSEVSSAAEAEESSGDKEKRKSGLHMMNQSGNQCEMTPPSKNEGGARPKNLQQKTITEFFK
jgi:hypothetical protein